MGTKLQKIILVLSLSMNLGFIATWATRTMPHFIKSSGPATPTHDASTVSSSFHKELGVNDDQWSQIEPQLKAFRDSATQQRREIMYLRQQLFALLAATTVDRKALGEKQEEILAAQHRMQNLVMNHLLAEKTILTESQSHQLIQALLAQSRKKGGIQKNFGLERLWKETSTPEKKVYENNMEKP